MTAPPGPPGSTDAELVARVLAADREAFATVYDRYGTRLYDFAYSMLRHREDAADAVADSFVLFAERLTQLRDPERLRPWLYAIVRSECLRRLKARTRIAYGDEEQLVEMADSATTPEEAAEQAALRQLVWDASAGLADRDRALLDLHLRQGLEGAELGAAIGVSASNAYVMLNRLRAQVDRSLGALLIARLGRDDCDDLDAILIDWDGGFSPLVRKRVARHVDQCDLCSERRKKMVSPWVLLAGVPAFVAPLTLRDRVLNDTQLVAHTVPGDVAAATTVGGRRWGAARMTMAAAALLAFAILATALLWPSPQEAAAPVEATPTLTTPSATTVPTAPATTEAASPTPSPTPSDTPEPTPSPSETPTQLPGSLIVSTSSLGLGTSASRATVGLRNAGDLPVSYRITPSVGWLTVSPADGRLGGAESSDVVVRADRTKVREGEATGRLVISWEGGTTTVRVSLREEREPVVGLPTTPSAPSCEVPVTVRVTDESRISAVRLSWSGPGGSGTAWMTASGASWTATIRITIGGTYALRATATDARGNTATGPTARINMYPCPQ